jgi:hypothetical protein
VPDPIPPGELEGLRAFELRVEARAGGRYPDRPVAVVIDGQRRDVSSIDSEWREEERLGYLVTLSDGRRLLLYYVIQEDLWSGVIQHDK